MEIANIDNSWAFRLKDGGTLYIAAYSCSSGESQWKALGARIFAHAELAAMWQRSGSDSKPYVFGNDVQGRYRAAIGGKTITVGQFKKHVLKTCSRILNPAKAKFRLSYGEKDPMPLADFVNLPVETGARKFAYNSNFPKILS